MFSGIGTHLTNRVILRKWINLIFLPRTIISHLTSEDRPIPAGLSNLWRLLPAANSGIFLQEVCQNISICLNYMVSKYHLIPLNLRTWTKWRLSGLVPLDYNPSFSQLIGVLFYYLCCSISDPYFLTALRWIIPKNFSILVS